MSAVVLGIVAMAVAAIVALVVPASAQSTGVLGPGNAVVTGFSGAPLPVQIVAGQNPGDLTFIDPKGPSAQVFNLQAAGAPPQAQVMPAPASLTVTAAQVGQVFGVALDNATPPNIFVAATSAYGLPIVVPGQGGTPARVHQGAPGAAFMAGLFGPGGGPGSIWRIDGVTGAVRLFANVTFDGAANSGPALGGLAFDSDSKSLFVADRQTGIIHRFNLSGTEIGKYDHGVQGLAAAAQPQVPYTPSALDITNPQFSSDNPATWDYAQPQRLVFGLGVHAERLYYAVAAGLQVWSVGIATNGSFDNDARLEVQVPPAQGPSEIAKIVFDDSGNMILAERGAPTGDYAFEAVAQAGIGRVLHYAPVAGAPPAPGSLWQPVPDQYASGFPGQYTNANGGVAIGYSYDANGNLDPGSCGGFVWSTGEQMRNAADQTLAAALAANGSFYLNGLQGNGIGVLEPANVPPLLSYYIDYDPLLDDPAARGHMGDIAIPRNCGQAPPQQSQLPPPPPPLPPENCPPERQTVTGKCCPSGEIPQANGSCARLLPPPPPPPPSGNCMRGYVQLPSGSCCLPGQVARDGQCCPAGERPGANGSCQPYGGNGCPPGEVMGRNNTCGPPPGCPNGMTRNSAGTCVCPAGERIDGGTIKCATACPPGQVISPTTGRCAPVPCPAGWEPTPNGTCLRNPTTCPPGQTLGANGLCTQTPPPHTCPLGERWSDQANECQKVVCPPGEGPDGVGGCVPATPCPSGQARNERGVCAAACPAGEVRDLAGDCRTGILQPTPTPCPPGQHFDSSGRCVPVCTIPGQVNTSLPGSPCACPPGTGLSANGCSEGYCDGGTFLGPGNCSCPQGSELKSNGVCTCPAGQLLVNGSCTKLQTLPPSIPCQGGNVQAGKCECSGTQTDVNGVCTTGPRPPTPPPPPCPSGQTRDASGNCVATTLPACPTGELRNASGTCVRIEAPPPPPCPSGETRNASGACVATTLPACPTGESRNASGACVKIEAPPPPPCPSGETRNASGACVATTLPACPTGESRNASGACVKIEAPPPPPCPSGETRNASGACVATTLPACPTGQTRNASGVCVAIGKPPSPPPCPRGQQRNASGACVKG